MNVVATLNDLCVLELMKVNDVMSLWIHAGPIGVAPRVWDDFNLGEDMCGLGIEDPHDS